MNTTAHDVSTTGRLRRGDAMALAATEYDRFVAAVDGLTPDDWARPTDKLLHYRWLHFRFPLARAP